MENWIFKNTTTTLDVSVTRGEIGVTGLSASIKVNIKRKSDGLYWNGATWVITKYDLTVTEDNATDNPGNYYYDWVNDGVAGTYFVRWYITGGINAFDKSKAYVVVDAWGTSSSTSGLDTKLDTVIERTENLPDDPASQSIILAAISVVGTVSNNIYSLLQKVKKYIQALF